MMNIDLQLQHGDRSPFSSPLSLAVIFYFPYHSIKKRRAIQKQNKPRADIDNLLKFLLDSLVFASVLSDDRIIYSVTALKKYDLIGRTEFTLTEEE